MLASSNVLLMELNPFAGGCDPIYGPRKGIKAVALEMTTHCLQKELKEVRIGEEVPLAISLTRLIGDVFCLAHVGKEGPACGSNFAVS